MEGANKRKSFIEPVGINGSNVKNETFISEIEWLTLLKCRATGLSTSLFLIFSSVKVFASSPIYGGNTIAAKDR